MNSRVVLWLLMVLNTIFVFINLYHLTMGTIGTLAMVGLVLNVIAVLVIASVLTKI